jgi:hypothetical protein
VWVVCKCENNITNIFCGVSVTKVNIMYLQKASIHLSINTFEIIISIRLSSSLTHIQSNFIYSGTIKTNLQILGTLVKGGGGVLA